jgi:hypothetical protein
MSIHHNSFWISLDSSNKVVEPITIKLHAGIGQRDPTVCRGRDPHVATASRCRAWFRYHPEA